MLCLFLDELAQNYSEGPRLTDQPNASSAWTTEARGASRRGIDIGDGHGPLESIWREVISTDTVCSRQSLRNKFLLKSVLVYGLSSTPFMLKPYSLHDQDYHLYKRDLLVTVIFAVTKHLRSYLMVKVYLGLQF